MNSKEQETVKDCMERIKELVGRHEAIIGIKKELMRAKKRVSLLTSNVVNIENLETWHKEHKDAVAEVEALKRALESSEYEYKSLERDILGLFDVLPPVRVEGEYGVRYVRRIRLREHLIVTRSAF